MTWIRVLVPLVLVAVAACQSPDGDDAGTPATPASLAPPAVAAEAAVSPTTEATGVGSGTVGTLAAWQTQVLVDVRTGERFTIGDLAGQAVVIEPMAIWCTNCAHQQREAATALASLSQDGIVYISLDVDPSERAEDLAAYADERGFDWRFVVADRAMSRALAQHFGDQVLSPPSTPKILVSRGGAVSGPNFGIQDAAAIEAEIRDLLS